MANGGVSKPSTMSAADFKVMMEDWKKEDAKAP